MSRQIVDSGYAAGIQFGTPMWRVQSSISFLLKASATQIPAISSEVVSGEQNRFRFSTTVWD